MTTLSGNLHPGRATGSASEAESSQGQRFFLNCMGGIDLTTNLARKQYCTMRLSFPTRFCGATDEHCISTELHCVESI